MSWRQSAAKYTHIVLKELPKSALPSDIRRALAQCKVEGITDISMVYHRFLPTGRAYLSFARREHVLPAAHALRNVTISSLPVRAIPCPAPEEPPRIRGVVGRARAAERGVIQGNGLRGGLGLAGTNVVLWGLPGKLTEHGLKASLMHFQLVGTEGGKEEIYKIHKPDSAFAVLSRFIVRTASISEAHRLVRYLHMTHFRPDTFQDKYLVRARVVY